MSVGTWKTELVPLIRGYSLTRRERLSGHCPMIGQEPRAEELGDIETGSDTRDIADLKSHFYLGANRITGVLHETILKWGV